MITVVAIFKKDHQAASFKHAARKKLKNKSLERAKNKVWLSTTKDDKKTIDYFKRLAKVAVGFKEIENE